MNKSSLFYLLAFGVVHTCGAATADIPPGKTRAETLTYAKSLLVLPSSSVPSIDATTLKNPFNPAEAPPPPVSPTGGPTADVVAGPEPTTAMQLAEIAPKITPSGAVEIGGRFILLFGQKKFKVGDALPIIFEGKPYQLDIVDIQSTSFTLRLNGVEITRPIKSVSKP